MKTYFLIVAIVCSMVSLNAQTLAPNAVIWNTPVYCHPVMVATPENCYFEVRSVGATAQSYFALSKLDSSGSPIWEKQYDWNPTSNWYDEIHDLAALPDSGVVLAGYQRWFNGTPYAYHVVRLDKDGQFIWQKKFTLDSTILTGKIHVKVTVAGIITLISAAHGIINGGHGIHFFQCDLNGNYINQALISVASGMNSVEDVIIYGGDTIVVTGYLLSNPFILKVNSNLQIVNSIISTTYLHFYNILHHPNGDFYVSVRSLYSNNTPRITVLRLNTSFQVLDTASFQYTLTNYRVNCFSSGPNQSSNIYFGGSGFSGCYGFPSTSNCYLLTIDTALNIISSYKYFGEGPRTLLVDEEGPILSTVTYLGATGQYAVNYFQTDTSGILNCNFDAELPAIVFNPPINIVTWSCTYLQPHNFSTFNTSATVINTWSSFNTYDFCLFDNNADQPSVDVLKIAPNPTINNITITGLTATATYVTVTGIDGQITMQKPAAEGMNIDLSQMANGCYFISVADAEYHIITRQLVIKQ